MEWSYYYQHLLRLEELLRHIASIVWCGKSSNQNCPPVLNDQITPIKYGLKDGSCSCSEIGTDRTFQNYIYLDDHNRVELKVPNKSLVFISLPRSNYLGRHASVAWRPKYRRLCIHYQNSKTTLIISKKDNRKQYIIHLTNEKRSSLFICKFDT